MSKRFKTAATLLGAASVAILALSAAGSASHAAKPNIKNYCERVCTDDASCIYSCSYVKQKPKRIKLPPTTTRPEPEPVPYVANWRDSVLNPTGGSGGGGGGGNGR